MIETVLFDVGGVLGAYHITLIREYLRQEGKDVNKEVNRDRFQKLMLDRRALTQGLGTLDQLLRSEYQDIKVTAEDIVRQFGKIETFNRVWKIAQELKEKGLTVSIISDQTAEGAQYFRQRTELTTIFDPIFFSCEQGATKQDGELFTHVQNTLQKEPNSLLVVEYARSIAERARKNSWHAIEFLNAVTLQRDLEKYELQCRKTSSSD